MRTTLCFDFARASVLALCLVFTVPAAIAQGGGEQGSSNGRPFTSVLEQLQAEIAAIEAAQQNELECIKDYLNGTQNATGPCPDFSSSIIADLEARVEQLEADVDALELTVQNADCPPGSSLRSIDPLTCEFDDDTNDQLIIAQTFGDFSAPITYNTSRVATATCLENFVVTNCGWTASPFLTIVLSRVSSVRSCIVTAAHTNIGYIGSSGVVQAIVSCHLASPVP